MASTRAKMVRLALLGAAAVAVAGGGVFLFGGSRTSGATYTSPSAATAAPSGSSSTATASGSGAVQPAPQTPTPPPADRVFALGGVWNPVQMLTAPTAAAGGPAYVVSFGVASQPARIPVPAQGQSLTVDEANGLVKMQGAGAHLGAQCLTPDQAVCLVAAIGKGGQAKGHPVYTIGARQGGAMVPIGATDAMERGPLVVDLGGGHALFSDSGKTTRELVNRTDLAEYLLILAENVPAMQQDLARQREKKVGLAQFQWVNKPGYQEATIRFVIGDEKTGPKAEVSVTADAPARGFVRLTMQGFRILTSGSPMPR